MDTLGSDGKARDSAYHRLKPSLALLGEDGPAALLAATADVAIVVDRQGIVRAAAASPDEPFGETLDLMLGKPLVQAVTSVSRAKVAALVEETRSGAATRWREINIAGVAGEQSLRVTALSLGEDILVVGRSQRAVTTLQQRLIETQRSMERDYARLRQAETRYRQLLDLVGDGVVIVDVGSLKAVEANAAAQRLLGIPGNRIPGRAFTELFDPPCAEIARDLLAQARGRGAVEAVELHRLADGAPLLASASTYRQDGGAFAIVRVVARDAADAANPDRPFAALVEGMPDAVVITGEDRLVVAVNGAFLDMAQLSSLEQARGRSIETWLGRGEADFNLVITGLREHGVVRDFSTVFRGEFGATETVEVSAVASPATNPPTFGFVVRNIGLRPDKNPFAGGELPRNADQLVDLVGRMSLREIVRETADVIEKLCVEAALRATGDNRAAAANMLGLSRQSLYAKLRRYGLGDVDFDNET